MTIDSLCEQEYSTFGMFKELPTSDFCEELQKRILSLHHLLWIETFEEERVLNEIQQAVDYIKNRPFYAQSVPIHFGLWSFARGLTVWENPPNNSKNKPAIVGIDIDTRDAIAAIDWIASFCKDIVVVFQDLPEVLDNPMLLRRVKDFVLAERSTKAYSPPAHTIIVTTPRAEVPFLLSNSVHKIKFPAPNFEQYEKCLDDIIHAISKSYKKDKKDKKESHEQIVFNFLGDKKEFITKFMGKPMKEFEDEIAYRLIARKPAK